MGRIVSITPEILIKLCDSEEFRQRQPSLYSAIMRAPGHGYKCCKDRKETLWARNYWEKLKKRILKLKKDDIIFIKNYIGADSLFVSYVDENQQRVCHML